MYNVDRRVECGTGKFRDALPLIVSRNQRHVTNHKIEVRTTYERRCDQQAGELISIGACAMQKIRASCEILEYRNIAIPGTSVSITLL